MTIVVTDHAILRWLERVEKIDIESLRKQLAASAAIGKSHGAAAVVVSGGKIVMRGDTVVTVLHRNGQRRELLETIEAELTSRNIVMHRKFRRRRK